MYTHIYTYVIHIYTHRYIHILFLTALQRSPRNVKRGRGGVSHCVCRSAPVEVSVSVSVSVSVCTCVCLCIYFHVYVNTKRYVCGCTELERAGVCYMYVCMYIGICIM